jgi:predicted RNA-binding Zn-ribbon protein involved in translation (DUF1610 family)
MLQPTIAQLPPEEATEPTDSDNTVANLSSPWEFDDTQPYCAHCAVEFTPLNRRHHCRSCGAIFCGRCSDQRSLIPPSSIVLCPKGGKKAKPRTSEEISFSPDPDPDRMLTFVGNDEQVLYGKGLEERFTLAREPLRVCLPCHTQLAPLARRFATNEQQRDAIQSYRPHRSRGDCSIRLWHSHWAMKFERRPIR